MAWATEPPSAPNAPAKTSKVSPPHFEPEASRSAIG